MLPAILVYMCIYISSAGKKGDIQTVFFCFLGGVGRQSATCWKSMSKRCTKRNTKSMYFSLCFKCCYGSRHLLSQQNIMTWLAGASILCSMETRSWVISIFTFSFFCLGKVLPGGKCALKNTCWKLKMECCRSRKTTSFEKINIKFKPLICKKYTCQSCVTSRLKNNNNGQYRTSILHVCIKKITETRLGLVKCWPHSYSNQERVVQMMLIKNA